jgi:hypothetical protein
VYLCLSVSNPVLVVPILSMFRQAQHDKKRLPFTERP